MPRNKLQPSFTSLTETSLHEPLTDHKIVRAQLHVGTVGSTVRTLEVLTESPDTFFLACTIHARTLYMYMYTVFFNIIVLINVYMYI